MQSRREAEVRFHKAYQSLHRIRRWRGDGLSGGKNARSIEGVYTIQITIDPNIPCSSILTDPVSRDFMMGL